MEQKDLLDFYKKKLDELQSTDDKYKEKVDKYLRELIEDRHELASENLRKGEKISDLQTALVDLQLNCFDEREKFLKVSAENENLKLNELKLHENIRQLLSVTKEKDLRDRIIYILDDPNVEIGYRYENSNSTGSLPAFNRQWTSDDLLKKQIHQLQGKLEAHSKVSQTKTDVILDDCKITLEKSKEQLLQNEEDIRILQKKLQDAEELLKGENKSSTSRRSVEKKNLPSDQNSNKFQSWLTNKSSSENISTEKFSSCIVEMRLSLAFLSKILTKSLSILSNIQSSQVFMEASKVSKQTSASHKYVTETDILQLQNYIRQCTRLSFEANNSMKFLNKIISSDGNIVREFKIKSEIRELQTVIEELAMCTGEADLITINLSRATFFEYLIAPKQPFVKFGVKEIKNLSKYVEDVNNIVSNFKMAADYVSKSGILTEKIQENIAILKHGAQSFSNINQDDRISSTNQHTSTSQEHSNSNSKERAIISDQDPLSKVLMKRISKNSVEIPALINNIDKTLSKINQVKTGEYVKDSEFCRYLGEQVKDLTERLNQLHNEFNIQDIQDKFHEYSSMTLRKLETIAKQSRDSVISAEAQISAHRSHAKNLSRKLKDTEELLRVSINECLSLKQKLHKEKIKRTEEITQLREGLREKLESVADFDELETAVQEVISSTQSSSESQSDTPEPDNPTEAKKSQYTHDDLVQRNLKKFSKESQFPESRNRNQPSKGSQTNPDGGRGTIQSSKTLMKGHEKLSRYEARHERYTDDSSSESETAVKKVSSVPLGPKKPEGLFKCMFCKQGSEHKLCDEKIRELRAENRSVKTELKLLQQEIREEKKVTKLSQDQADRAVHQSASQSESLSRRLESLEARNASLLEQLNLERNRLKKMEKFRRFEIAGAQTDIKNLKLKIQELDKQLVKAVMIFEHDKKDFELLKSVHTTAQNSKQAVEGVKRIKRKLYELETDLKHL